MTLYHYSNIAGLDFLSPKHFGRHLYTRADRDICPLPRLYFYTSRDVTKEYRLGSFLYKVKLPTVTVEELKQQFPRVRTVRGFLTKAKQLNKALVLFGGRVAVYMGEVDCVPM